MKKITIYRDDVYAGAGRLDSDGEIVDCDAMLGETQDDSDTTYEMIADAIDSDSIMRPDGVYTWSLGD